MPPPARSELHTLSDADLDEVGAGWVKINVAGPTISNGLVVQLNVANQVANSILSSAGITQLIGQVNVT